MTDEVRCPYKGKCKSEGYKCASCKNNSKKKDYYDPDDDWYIPYYPYQPWYPGYPYDGIIWCSSGRNSTSEKVST